MRVLVRQLSYKPPFAVAELLAYLRARAIPGVEAVHDGAYRRSVRHGDSVAVIELRPAAGGVELSAPPALEGLAAVRSRELLDLDADPGEVDAWLRRFELLRPLVAERRGLRVAGAYDRFELGVRAIVGQQVSVAAASTVAGRVAARAGDALDEPSGSITQLFPTPEQLAAADLTGLGMTGQRQRTISAFAAAVASGDVTLDGSVDRASAHGQLLAVPGIGPWTAAYVAMRALRDPDAIPHSDLGLRTALVRLGVDAPVEEVSAPWSPWRGYGAMHLWASLAGAPSETVRPRR